MTIAEDQLKVNELLRTWENTPESRIAIQGDRTLIRGCPLTQLPINARIIHFSVMAKDTVASAQHPPLCTLTSAGVRVAPCMYWVQSGDCGRVSQAPPGSQGWSQIIELRLSRNLLLIFRFRVLSGARAFNNTFPHARVGALAYLIMLPQNPNAPGPVI